METRLFSKITLSLAVMAALAACGEKAAEKPAADAAAPASAATASQVTAAPAVDNSNASPEDQDLLKRAQGVFKPLPSAEEMQQRRPFTEEQVKLERQRLGIG